MKKFIWLMLIVPSVVFGKETYWKVEKVKPIIQTSLIFETVMASLSAFDHFTYDDDSKQIWYYDGYNEGKGPRLIDGSFLESDTKSEKEGRVEVRLMGSKLKILIYQNNKNIAFIICEKAGSDKKSFLESVADSRKLITDQKLAALKAHAPVSLPATNTKGDTKVALDGFSISLPADKYFITQPEPGKYEILDKASKDLTKAFTITNDAFNGNDSLVRQELYPLLKEGNLWVNTAPYYDWRTKEKGTQGYVLSNSLRNGDKYLNIISEEKESLKELLSVLPAFRSITTDSSGAVSLASYNFRIESEPEMKAVAGALAITLPARYEIREFSGWGSFAFDASPKLRFSDQNPNCKYYPVKDTATKTESAFDVERGGVFSMKDGSLKTGIGDIIESLKDDNIGVLAQDRSGVVYNYHDNFYFLRYIQKGDTHYVYQMEFPTLAACLKEFGRSAPMF